MSGTESLLATGLLWRCLLIEVRTMALHEHGWIAERRESELAVESVRIARRKGPPGDGGRGGVVHDDLNEPAAEALSAKLVQNEDIGQVGECRHVGDHARKTDLPALAIQPEWQGALDSAFHDVTRNIRGPVP